MQIDRPIEQQYLWINGKISSSSFDLIKSGLPSDKPFRSEILFIGYSFADIPVGKSFSIIFPKNNPNNGFPCESKIVAVTQQFGIAIDIIPGGWKTICIVEFSQGIPEIIENLPIVDTWFENKDYVCICDEDAWKAIKKL